MKQFLNVHAQELKQGGIRAFFDQAAQYPDAIHLGIGEPDFPTPKAIIEAGEQALAAGYTHYTPNAGLPEVRQSVARYLEKMGVKKDPKSEIIMTCGGMGAIFQAIMCVVSEGDEVILQDPQWVNYDSQIRFAGGVPVRVPVYEADHFRLQPERLEAAITEKTKMIMLNSPNNPTGMILTAAELEKIAEIAKRHNILVLSDEVYCELRYQDGPFLTIAAIPGMEDNVLIVNSMSKTFAMTGWRIGFAAGPKQIIQKMIVLQENMLACAPAAGQKAAEYAMDHMSNVAEMRKTYEERRNLLVNGLNEIPGITCTMPDGAFYAFPNIRKTGMTSMEFCQKLLEEAHVVVIPGSSFGACGEGYVRIAYSNSNENIAESLKRIRAFVERHTK